ncbi:Epimerase [Gammaproteobacteria bacterium]
MKVKKVCILGGTGFVGRRLALSLSLDGYRVRVLSRHPQRHRDLESRDVEVLEANVHDEAQLRDQFVGVDAVINLVGILNERGVDGRGFRRVHVDLPRTVVAACKAAGVGRLLHMSALKAGDPAAMSHYLRTKGEGEDLVHAAAGDDLAVTSFRPSVIFGQNDGFLNRFASLLRIAPIMPLACSESRFAPIYVGDVVAAFCAALKDPTSHGGRYDLCGPKIYTLRQIVDYAAKLLRLPRLVIPLSATLSRLQAQVLEQLPGKLLSMDNYLSLQLDSTCTLDHKLPFAISPTPLEAIAPYYIGNRSQRSRYDQLRSQAGRES